MWRINRMSNEHKMMMICWLCVRSVASHCIFGPMNRFIIIHVLAVRCCLSSFHSYGFVCVPFISQPTTDDEVSSSYHVHCVTMSLYIGAQTRTCQRKQTAHTNEHTARDKQIDRMIEIMMCAGSCVVCSFFILFFFLVHLSLLGSDLLLQAICDGNR